MPQKILALGAEAVIFKMNSKQVLKDRIPKGYRHPELDKKLRKQRTKAETKLLTKASRIISTPKIISPNNKSFSKQKNKYQITMQYISGKKLSDHLDKIPNYRAICKQIGRNIALLHNAGLIHGDLTTSNMILTTQPTSNKKPSLKKNDKSKSISKKPKQLVYFIDFGLGFHSEKIEDKATDLHLIKESLEARHSKIFKKAFKSVLEGYKKSKNYKSTLMRLKRVEKRGRYKAQY